MKKLKKCWDILKIISALIAATTLAFSRIPDNPVPGYKSQGPLDPIPLVPAVMGIHQETWLMLSVVTSIIVALIVATDGVMGLWRSRKARLDEALKNDIRRVILATLKTLSESTGINIVHLGGSVFIYKKKRNGFRLFLLERYRLDDYPPRSDIKWTKGKGAIGEAVEKRRTIHCDWVALSKALHGPQASSDDLVSSLSASDRFGFTDEELREMASKYYECLATPILSQNDAKILGVLAIDIPNRADVKLNNAILADRHMEEVVAVPAAALVALTLEPLYTSS